jgi:hypothetical protein
MDQYRSDAMTKDPGPRELGDSLRVFLDEAQSAFGSVAGEARLRTELVGPRPFVSLVFLMCRSPDFRARFVGEVLEAICGGPSTSLLLARDVLRSMPRSTLEQTLPGHADRILRSADEQTYSRLFEIIVELRLAEAAAVIRDWARSHADEEIGVLGESLDSIEEDPSRWGRLVSEWPIRGR